MPTQLHELLAVETSLATTASRISKEVTKTLETKSALFAGLTKLNVVFDEASQHTVQAPEIKEVETTVKEQLDFLGNELVRYWDVILQKEEANQRAKADIIVDGTTLVANVPSIVLLSMEKKLEALLATYNVIPTLDSAKAWEIDSTYAKPGVYRTKHVAERQQTQIVKDFQMVAPATDKHPAQVVQVEKTNIIGKYLVTEYSGATTSLDKAEKLQRLTNLIRAVKAARQRANNTEVATDIRFGTALINYING